MLRFAALRSATALLVLWLVASLAFLAIQLAPGDAASRVLDPRASQRQIEQIRSLYGFDDGVVTQYLRWLGNSLRGDTGISFLYQQPTLTVIRERLGPTVLLGASATAVGVGLGLLLGWISAARRHRWPDLTIRGVGLILYATPSFWLGLMLILLFAGILHWLPSGGLAAAAAPVHSSPYSPGRWFETARHLALPTIVLAVPLMVQVSRLVRFGMGEELDREYVRVARAHGLSPRAVRAMALRNSVGPVLQVLGLWLPVLVSGAVVVERVFSWPGLGSAAVEAISARDVPLMMGLTVLTAAFVVLGNLLADVAHAMVDPRVTASDTEQRS